MLIESHNNMRGNPHVEATEALVRDFYGNAVVLISDLGDGVIQVRTPGDAGFAELAAQMGVQAPDVVIYKI